MSRSRSKMQRQIASRRRKRGIYKVSREERRNMSLAKGRQKRDFFSKNPGGKRLSISAQTIRWILGKSSRKK